MNNSQITPYPLRIPQELRTVLEAQARAADRSLQAHIIRLLETAGAEQQSASNPSPDGYLVGQRVILNRQEIGMVSHIPNEPLGEDEVAVFSPILGRVARYPASSVSALPFGQV